MSLLSSWHGFWQARAPRERRALTLMALVVGGATLGQTAWSAAQESSRLARQAPLRAQERLRVERAASELQTPVAPPKLASPLSGEALDAALRRDLPRLQGSVALRLTAPRKFEVKGEGDFAALLTWLAQAQSAHGLFVSSAEIQRGAGGRASFTVELVGA